MKLPAAVTAFFREKGIEGGKKRMSTMTPAQRRKFSMQGVAARKRTKRKP